MTLKVKYFIFIVLLHAALGVLLFQVIEKPKILVLVAELGLILSLLVAYQLYVGFVRPVSFIKTGVDAIRDEDFNVKFVLTGSKEMDQLIVVYNQMIDNIRKERVHLKEQHYFLNKLIQASPNGVIVLNHNQEIAEINPLARKLLLLPEYQDSNDYMDHSIVNQVIHIEPGASKILSNQGIQKIKCEASEFIHRGFKRKFILLQEMSKEILETEKQAYGQVVRMMAHEVNNSIGAVNSILSSVSDMQLELKSLEAQEIIEALEVAIDRNAKLNQFMKNFASVVRLPAPSFEIIDLKRIVKSIARLMEPLAEEHHIQLDVQLPPDAIMIHADPHQIEQVLVNVLKNGIEAIVYDGKIQLQVLENGVLRIRNNGQKIPKAMEAQLFSPFFSTKKNGQGIGLTLVKEILINHQTSFSLKTEEDGWTTFQIGFKGVSKDLVGFLYFHKN